MPSPSRRRVLLIALVSACWALAGASDMVRAARLAQGGKLDEALDAYRSALASAAPDMQGVIYHEMAMVVAEQGNAQEALFYFDRAIKHADAPMFATQARFNKALTLMRMDRNADALEEFLACTTASPDFLPAHIKAAFLFSQRGDHARTLAHLQHALRLQTHMYMGDTLNNLKRFGEAVEQYQLALRAAPEEPELLNRVGDSLQNQGKPAEARGFYARASRRAALSRPASRATRVRALAAAGAQGPPARGDGAALRSAAHAVEQHTRALLGLLACASAVGDWRGYDALVASVLQGVEEELLAGRPSSLSPYLSLFLPASADLRRRIAESWAAQHLRTARAAAGAAHEQQPGGAHPRPMAVPAPPSVEPPHAGNASVSRPLALAYLSRRVEDYAGTHLMLGLFPAHAARSRHAPAETAAQPQPAGPGLGRWWWDEDGALDDAEGVAGARATDRAAAAPPVHTHVYAHGPDDGSWERRHVRAWARHFEDVSQLPAAAVREAMGRMNVHVVLDYDGAHDFNNMAVQSARSAPVQMSFLGFAGTTGCRRWPAAVRARWAAASKPGDEPWGIPLPCMDYLVADRVVVPLERWASHASEAALVMPFAYQPQNPVPLPLRASAWADRRREQALPVRAFVFACFLRHQKIDPATFAVWMHILRRAPRAVLWLLEGTDSTRANLVAMAASHGVAPSRLVFASRAPRLAHIARHALADAVLDAGWYNSHTTAADALWAGVPLLTLKGPVFSMRVAASLLEQARLSALVTSAHAEYEEVAVALARGGGGGGADARAPGLAFGARALWTRALRSTPLFDNRRFASDVERAARLTWEVHASGRAPQHVVVGRAHHATAP